MSISPPRYIALCGAPLVGKDEVAQILVNRYGAIQVDTAVPLRRGAARAVVGGATDWVPPPRS